MLDLEITRKAAKEFAALSVQDQRRFERLLTKLRAGHQGVQWKHFVDQRAMDAFGGTGSLWEAKASHELRLLTDGRHGKVRVVSFTRRSDRRVFHAER